MRKFKSKYYLSVASFQREVFLDRQSAYIHTNRNKEAWKRYKKKQKTEKEKRKSSLRTHKKNVCCIVSLSPSSLFFFPAFSLRNGRRYDRRKMLRRNASKHRRDRLPNLNFPVFRLRVDCQSEEEGKEEEEEACPYHNEPRECILFAGATPREKEKERKKEKIIKGNETNLDGCCWWGFRNAVRPQQWYDPCLFRHHRFHQITTNCPGNTPSLIHLIFFIFFSFV